MGDDDYQCLRCWQTALYSHEPSLLGPTFEERFYALLDECKHWSTPDRLGD